MTAKAFRSLRKWHPASLAVFGFGIMLLIGTWIIWYWWISLFTEVLLVPWSCCGLDILPLPGTWQRTVNDFFSVFPGNMLPATLFILAEFTILSLRLAKAKNKILLPLIFSMGNILLLVIDLFVTSFSWAVSDYFVGPREGIDAGFHRTWYGIVAHLSLWGVFLWLCSR